MKTNHRTPNDKSAARPWPWIILLAVWTIVLSVLPDPRPLSAPEWLVRLVVSTLGVGEPTARLVATVGLRTGGLFVLGMITAIATVAARRRMTKLVVVPVIATGLGIATLWINYGYFPIDLQLRLAVPSIVLGTWTGFALKRNRSAAALVVLAIIALAGWATSTGISDEFYAAGRATGRHVLENESRFSAGDEGFAELMEEAFRVAERSVGTRDPVLANRAAILALGVILGEEKVADVAKRQVDLQRLAPAAALRRRITLGGRADWTRHFWVSAGLTVLTDEERTMGIGVLKELMDSTAGGSGFSFGDLAADRAGNLFALAATRDADSARAMQSRIRAGVAIPDFFPEAKDLPEGLTQDQLQSELGGLGGEGTQKIIADIRRRLAGCAALR